MYISAQLYACTVYFYVHASPLNMYTHTLMPLTIIAQCAPKWIGAIHVSNLKS